MGVEETIGVTETAPIPKQRGEQLLDHAVRYTEERHWDVFAGTWLEVGNGRELCSCGAEDCPAPGAHPAVKDWAAQASGSAVQVRRIWGKQPNASILLPTGRTFDALDVPDSAGFLALARLQRMNRTVGPVTLTPEHRMLFFVLPGAGAKVPDLVRKLGWSPSTLDLVARSEGQYVAAPPTRFGGRGSVQWAQAPTAANRWLPDAEELIDALAYACGREAADARNRKQA
ncbi:MULTISPECIES: bifunctional DNA primase/polymerase [unclassified Streptomyces]|uniref:bifunctional DNA primase/polymerase n=1 Tax=unclassified Streptomyces TaxID=2593676 RepID=UPI001BEA1591|nr:MULTISPECIES: bifunctional DNA primase/polymerase [unclassified Streptomyces]MBT2405631.1 bifunctional DNA primase/polymerase [Streptomyces sp. ISL-21]MBT2457148.1 bifunctional DNA primase/polymerase [Streptomyces sp. ISL-86]MBT2608165.1 bifunctional DNA primase/polymerase [Streptomyces sp. ISL-87]